VATDAQTRSPWLWTPSLYFAQGIPYVAATSLSVVMYKRLGISNAEIAFYTSLLGLPWVIKPCWSPVVDLLGTKRRWILATQLAIALALAAAGLAVQAPHFFAVTLTVFWVLAFASSTHDIAADGFYMLGLSQRDQAWFVGVRSTFFRLSLIAGNGIIVMLAAKIETRTGNIPLAWSVALLTLAAMFLALRLWHGFALPRPGIDGPATTGRAFASEFYGAFESFFRKPGIVPALAFILLYRFAEAQSTKLIIPFLLDKRDVGGLGLTTAQEGFAYGTVGVAALLAGGILGGFSCARRGLKRMLPIMVCAIHIPNLAFVYLSYAQPGNLGLINALIAAEQFGYGFGFAAYMLFLLHFADGERKTAHYAICTGLMALGMMVPGLFSGWLQETLGYRHFFVWVMLATIPGFLAAFWANARVTGSK